MKNSKADKPSTVLGKKCRRRGLRTGVSPAEVPSEGSEAATEASFVAIGQTVANGTIYGMLALLVVLFIAELWVIVQVAFAIGVLETVGLLIAITIIGVWLVKRQGVAVLVRLQRTLAEGRVPHRELVDGFLILAAGILLIPPGFITDAVGIALLVPPIRIGIRELLMRSFRKRSSIAVRVIDGFGRRVDYRDVGSRESRSGDVRFPEPGQGGGPGTRQPPELER
jgi:UPF0716 protein FxsA